MFHPSVPESLGLSSLALDWAQPATGALQQALESLGGLSCVTDLITATAQDHGLQFPADRLTLAVEQALQGQTVRHYSPDPMGQLPAREGVSGFYARRSYSVSPNQVLLTPGTSLGYLMCFRLLCNRGDEVLIPRPGYPLFDDLAAIAGVGLRYYHLAHRGGHWALDLEEIRFQITPRTKAIVVVSPHNPTGHMPSAEDLAGLAELCREHGLALIFDEVFCEWLSPGETLPRPEGFPLALSLNGVSKMLALPQWKLAWLAVSGDSERVRPFLRAAEHFSDALLAVGEVQQAMLPALLAAEDVIGELKQEILKRRTAVRGASTLPLASEDRGVYVCLKLTEGLNDEAVALRLLREHRVLVHPGYYYDLPGHLVLTCINPAFVQAFSSITVSSP